MSKLNPDFGPAKDCSQETFIIIRSYMIVLKAEKGVSYEESSPFLIQSLALLVHRMMCFQGLLQQWHRKGDRAGFRWGSAVGWCWLMPESHQSLSTAGQGRQNIAKGSWAETGTERDLSPNTITGKTDSNQRYYLNLLWTKSEQNNEK